MSDNLSEVWNTFFNRRTKGLFDRFKGQYRAVVVETNDPLQLYRVRIKCPELHNFDLKDEECPWAVPAFCFGGKNAGSWCNVIRNDIIWVTWEKGHPYGPIWLGMADETRRKRYPLESIFTKSPLSVDESGKPDDEPDDFLEDFNPKDNRPMSHGWRDRYGNFEANSSIGFFPKEHEEESAPAGVDGISRNDFEEGSAPEVNDPDRKYLIRCTKYGIYTLMSDIGYFWQSNGGDEGEFKGDADEDREFEIERYKYLTKHFNEQEPKSSDRDQRRYEVRTRAGHLFEIRDVGWAQSGGGVSGSSPGGATKSRQDEYGDPKTLSKWSESDERWIKLRTKGGHLIQMMDAGFDPEEDEFYKRLIKEEIGPDTDNEKDAEWVSRDARQLRLVTRHGFKFVLDDRGSDPKKAEQEPDPKGNGYLLKTRRAWEEQEGTQRGFGFEANDKNELNRAMWYSPKSKIIELNDLKDYAIFCTDMSEEISDEWKKLDENEFARKFAMTQDPEQDTYHLKLDKFNGYLRLKTAAGGDNNRRAGSEGLEDAEEGENQGLEARDGRTGDTWCEVVDMEDRGIWLTKTDKLGIWRAREGKDMFILIHDGDNNLVIRNGEGGKLQIFSSKDIELIADGDISFNAGGRITMKAEADITAEVPGNSFQLESEDFGTQKTFKAQRVLGLLPQAFPGSGAQSPSPKTGEALTPNEITQEKIKPDDRGEVSNSFEEVNESVIKGE